MSFSSVNCCSNKWTQLYSMSTIFFICYISATCPKHSDLLCLNYACLYCIPPVGNWVMPKDTNNTINYENVHLFVFIFCWWDGFWLNLETEAVYVLTVGSSAGTVAVALTTLNKRTTNKQLKKSGMTDLPTDSAKQPCRMKFLSVAANSLYLPYQ